MTAETDRPAKASGRLAELDALRGLAALAVVLFHYSYQYPILFPKATPLPFSWEWAQNGIWLFFAISGFVISMTLERVNNGWDFVWARFSRLYPVYWAAMIITTSVVTLSATHSLDIPMTDKIANITMFENWLGMDAIDPVYWTLGVELCFYICMFGLYVSGFLDHLEWVLLPWVGLYLFQQLTGLLFFKAELLLVLSYIPYFAIGMLFYRYHRGLLPRWRLVGWQCMIIALVSVEGIEASLVASSIALLFGLMTMGWLSILSARLLLWLGAISYPLYLIHQNVGYVIMLNLDRAGVPIWATAAIAITSALVLAHMLHHFVEQPAQRWLRRNKPRIGVPPVRVAQ